jgi:hypothetical protein
MPWRDGIWECNAFERQVLATARELAEEHRVRTGQGMSLVESLRQATRLVEARYQSPAAGSSRFSDIGD